MFFCPVDVFFIEKVVEWEYVKFCSWNQNQLVMKLAKKVKSVEGGEKRVVAEKVIDFLILELSKVIVFT